MIFRRVRCEANWAVSRPSRGPRGLSEQPDEIIDHPHAFAATLEPFGFRRRNLSSRWAPDAKDSDKAAIVPIISALLYPIPDYLVARGFLDLAGHASARRLASLRVVGDGAELRRARAVAVAAAQGGQVVVGEIVKRDRERFAKLFCIVAH